MSCMSAATTALWASPSCSGDTGQHNEHRTRPPHRRNRRPPRRSHDRRPRPVARDGGGTTRRPAPPQADRHRPAGPRDADLPLLPLAGGHRPGRRLDRLRPRRQRGRDGRCAGRLVRRHRPVPTPAGYPGAAHRDHQAEERPGRSRPQRIRGRELPQRHAHLAQALGGPHPRAGRGLGAGPGGRGADRQGGRTPRRSGRQRDRPGRGGAAAAHPDHRQGRRTGLGSAAGPGPGTAHRGRTRRARGGRRRHLAGRQGHLQRGSRRPTRRRAHPVLGAEVRPGTRR